MRIRLLHTHAYPGCPVRTQPAQPADSSGEAICEFSDGNVQVGSYEMDRGRMILCIPAHQTTRGARIPAKRWSLQAVRNDEWRVVERLSP